MGIKNEINSRFVRVNQYDTKDGFLEADNTTETTSNSNQDASADVYRYLE